MGSSEKGLRTDYAEKKSFCGPRVSAPGNLKKCIKFAKMILGDIGGAGGLQTEYHRSLGTEDPQIPSRVLLPLLLGKDLPASFVSMPSPLAHILGNNSLIQWYKEGTKTCHPARRRPRRDVRPMVVTKLCKYTI